MKSSTGLSQVVEPLPSEASSLTRERPRRQSERGRSSRAVHRAALIFAVLIGGVVIFQLALALGAPWGEYAMGGSTPGTYPPSMRVAAVVQAGFLVVMGLVVLSRGRVALAPWSRVSRWAVWLVVAAAALSLFLNLITPSSGERTIWAPVLAVLLASSLVVGICARGKPQR